MAEPATAAAEAAVSQAQDLADLLSGRSPGARTQAELTKHARVAAKVRPKPNAIVPAGHPTPPEAPSTIELVNLLQPPVTPAEIATAELQPPFAPPPTLGAILASAPGDQGVAPPDDGGGPVSYPTLQPRAEVPPTSAVPEPGTWAMMLMGFGLIAWRVRRHSPAGTPKRVPL